MAHSPGHVIGDLVITISVALLYPEPPAQSSPFDVECNGKASDLDN